MAGEGFGLPGREGHGIGREWLMSPEELADARRAVDQPDNKAALARIYELVETMIPIASLGGRLVDAHNQDQTYALKTSTAITAIVQDLDLESLQMLAVFQANLIGGYVNRLNDLQGRGRR